MPTTIERWNNRVAYYSKGTFTGSDRIHDAPAYFRFERAGYYVWRHDPSALGGWVAYGPYRSPTSRACLRAVAGK
jgi:hypothetical protein